MSGTPVLQRELERSICTAQQCGAAMWATPAAKGRAMSLEPPRPLPSTPWSCPTE